MKKNQLPTTDCDITAMTPTIDANDAAWNYKTEKLQTTKDLIQNITNTYQNCLALKEHTKQLEMITNSKLQDLAAKYTLTRDTMNHVFSERNSGLNKQYEALDYAIKNNDREIIIASLKSISSIITQSPLEDLTEFTKRWNDTSQNMLDF